MGEKSIIAVGVSLASEEVEYRDFDSNDSLLDWDIVLFKPDISHYYSYSSDYYQGKPSLADTASFGFKERCEHWRREIKDAVEGGKTVIVFLPDIQEVWVDTGRREHSGTGRSRQTTRIVESYNKLSRSDPHLRRFLGKLALTSRSTRSRAKTRAPG